jgi:predicted DNA-binding transcriptional regulator AlpA
MATFSLSALPDNITLNVSKGDLIAFAKELRSQASATPQTPQPTEAVSEFMNLEEAAAFLKKAPQTVYGYCSKGTIPCIKQGGLYFQKSELEAWLLQGKCKTKAEIEAAAENHIVNRNKKGGRHAK